MTYPKIDDKALLIEVLRKSRKNSTPTRTGGFQGGIMHVAISILLNRLLSAEQFTSALGELIQEGSVILTSSGLRNKPGEKTEFLGQAIVSKLHPSATLDRSVLFLTPKGNIIRPRYKDVIDGLAVKYYPNEDQPYTFYSLDLCYVVEDGLPNSLEKLLCKPTRELI